MRDYIHHEAHQNFWGIVNKTTGSVSKGPMEYKIYKTREEARKFNRLYHKSKSGNYLVVRMQVGSYSWRS